MSGERALVSVAFFADLSCPWCYVGWEGLKRAAAAQRDKVALQLAWRTFMLQPDTPREGADRKAYLAARFDSDRLRAAHEALQSAAAELGAPLDLDAATRIPNTTDAHRLVHWAGGQGVAEGVIDALFRAYFVDGRDIGDRDALVAIGESAGLDPIETRQRLESDLDRERMRSFHDVATQIGVQGVPVAVFNRKIPVMGAQGVEAYTRAIEAARAA